MTEYLKSHLYVTLIDSSELTLTLANELRGFPEQDGSPFDTQVDCRSSITGFPFSLSSRHKILDENEVV